MNKGVFEMPIRTISTRVKKSTSVLYESVNQSKWPESLRESYERNSKNFNSDIFRSIWEINQKNRQDQHGRNHKMGFTS